MSSCSSTNNSGLTNINLGTANADTLEQVRLQKKVLQTQQSMDDAIINMIPPPSHDGSGRKVDYYA